MARSPLGPTLSPNAERMYHMIRNYGAGVLFIWGVHRLCTLSDGKHNNNNRVSLLVCTVWVVASRNGSSQSVNCSMYDN